MKHDVGPSGFNCSTCGATVERWTLGCMECQNCKSVFDLLNADEKAAVRRGEPPWPGFTKNIRKMLSQDVSNGG